MRRRADANPSSSGSPASPVPPASPASPASPPPPRPLPPAWQPLTWRGVAAFSRARFGRLLVVQSLVALGACAAVLWFLDTAWFPTLRQAIRQLPETGQMEHQQLASPRTSIEPLVETRWLAFVVDVRDIGSPHLASDVQVEFHGWRVVVCSFLGCRSIGYLAGWTMPFNRPELESWWEAWEPIIYLAIGAAVVVVLFATWWILATLYCPFVRLYAFFKDRALTLPGSWKLAAAALLPGSLLVSGSILLYGLGTIGLLRFCCLWLLHFPLSWVYLCLSPSRLPSVSDALPSARQNPFHDGDPQVKPALNPFASSKP